MNWSKSVWMGAASVAILLFGSIGLAARADLITKGSFEDPEAGLAEYSASDATATGITGWTVTSGKVTLTNLFKNDGVDGDQWLSLENSGPSEANGGSGGKITQTFTTTPQTTYNVSFNYAVLLESNNAFTAHLAYGVGDTSSTLIIDMPASGNDGPVLSSWTTKTFSFTATGNSTTLWFSGDQPWAGFYGSAIDKVTVNALPTPEPSTTILLGAGVCATGLYYLLRRRGAH